MAKALLADPRKMNKFGLENRILIFNFNKYIYYFYNLNILQKTFDFYLNY